MVIEQGQGQWYKYSVLVTNWPETDVKAIAQIYRDRCDAENQFDELNLNPAVQSGRAASSPMIRARASSPGPHRMGEVRSSCGDQ